MHVLVELGNEKGQQENLCCKNEDFYEIAHSHRFFPNDKVQCMRPIWLLANLPKSCVLCFIIFCLWKASVFKYSIATCTFHNRCVSVNCWCPLNLEDSIDHFCLKETIKLKLCNKIKATTTLEIFILEEFLDQLGFIYLFKEFDKCLLQRSFESIRSQLHEWKSLFYAIRNVHDL